MASCYDKATGEMKCRKCKYHHGYYGCLKHLKGAEGFVQIEQKKGMKFVHNNKSVGETCY